jgi:hypothetical protein
MSGERLIANVSRPLPESPQAKLALQCISLQVARARLCVAPVRVWRVPRRVDKCSRFTAGRLAQLPIVGWRSGPLCLSVVPDVGFWHKGDWMIPGKNWERSNRHSFATRAEKTPARAALTVLGTVTPQSLPKIVRSDSGSVTSPSPDPRGSARAMSPGL